MRFTIEEEIAAIKDADLRHLLERMNNRINTAVARIAHKNKRGAIAYLKRREEA